MRLVRACCLLFLVLAFGGCGGGGDSAGITPSVPPVDPAPPIHPTPHGFLEAPVLISPGSTAYDLSSSISANGDAVVAWAEYENNYRAVWVNVFDYSKDSWGGPVLLDEDCYYPRVASFGNGDAIAVWEHNSIGNRSINFSMYYKELGLWTDKRSISTGSANFLPKVATSQNGKAVIVWYGWKEGMLSVFGAVYSADDRTWIVEALETTSDYEFGINDLAMSPGGHAVLVYQMTGGIYIREHRSISGWMPPYSISSQHPNMSARAVMNDNIVAVSWYNFSFGELPQDVHFAKMENGVWSTPEVIESPNAGDSWDPMIAMNNEGIIVLWRHSNWNNDRDDYDNRIWANILTEDGWSGEQLLAENEYVSSMSAIEDNVVVSMIGPDSDHYFKSYSKGTGWSVRVIKDHVPGRFADALISDRVTMLVGCRYIDEDRNEIYTNWERRER